jgi:hypothetical protein
MCHVMKKLPLTAALIALSLVTPVPAQTIQAGGSSDAVFDVSKIRIRNFGRVNEIYYRGAQPKAGDYDDLSALGVRTVINLTSHDRDAAEAVYRMDRHGWDAKQAFREMKQYDFGADFLHPEFKDFVFEYGAEAARKAVASGAPAR